MQARSVSAHSLSSAPVVPFGCRVIVGIAVQLSLRLRRRIADCGPQGIRGLIAPARGCGLLGWFVTRPAAWDAAVAASDLPRIVATRTRAFPPRSSQSCLHGPWCPAAARSRVGGSIPPLATIQIKALVENDRDVTCPVFIGRPNIVGARGWHFRREARLLKGLDRC